jgi:hypothetical protein
LTHKEDGKTAKYLISVLCFFTHNHILGYLSSWGKYLTFTTTNNRKERKKILHILARYLFGITVAHLA